MLWCTYNLELRLSRALGVFRVALTLLLCLGSLLAQFVSDISFEWLSSILPFAGIARQAADVAGSDHPGCLGGSWLPKELSGCP